MSLLHDRLMEKRLEARLLRVIKRFEWWHGSPIAHVTGLTYPDSGIYDIVVKFGKGETED